MRKKSLRTKSPKRPTKRKPALQLQKETIRTLGPDDLGEVVAGITCPWSNTQTDTQQTKMPPDTDQR